MSNDKKTGWESFTELAEQINGLLNQDKTSDVGYAGVGVVFGVVFLLADFLVTTLLLHDAFEWLYAIIGAVVLGVVMAYFTKKYSK